MTTEQKRIAIAEACGWTKCRLAIKGAGGGTRWPTAHGVPPKRAYEAPCPNYFNDLNSCHEMEKSERLFGCWLNYENHVKETVLRDWRETGKGQLFANSFPIHATATQRAEAFGKTLGLWT